MTDSQDAIPEALPARPGPSIPALLFSRRGLLVIAALAIAAGLTLNWSWLVATGAAPILIAVLPCLVMCGLGLCMNKLTGGNCENPTRNEKGDL